ncbi:MAG: ABC transporter ATP-binding protein [Planctomycetaceae bacterium]|nr:ABC transporter ATP-binding protein [Planctomycetaceae bacterium]
MNSPAIQVDAIGKQYQLGLREKANETLREALVEMAKAPLKRLRHLSGQSDEGSTFWALRDVNFDVPEGEVLGIIGHNGAGKSTLLKILSRITEPTEGRAVIRGRVASLLEVGTGFHVELSGRENVFLNGAILGMSKAEITRKFDEIVAFSGVEKFLDTPIKRYSSGMKVRLAFAVAAHLEPEILIIDEVLAVGDQEFQNRCLGKMHDVARSGRTVLFVSHNMAAVESLCTSAMLLKAGKVLSIGTVREIVGQYLSGINAGAAAGRYENPDSPLREVRLVASDDRGVTDTVVCGQPATVQVVIRPEMPISDPAVRLVVVSHNGQRIFTCNSRFQYQRLATTGQELELHCLFEGVRLVPGDYTLSATLLSASQELAVAEPAIRFSVAPGDIYGTGRIPQQVGKGVYFPHVTWSSTNASADSLMNDESVPSNSLSKVS